MEVPQQLLPGEMLLSQLTSPTAAGVKVNVIVEEQYGNRRAVVSRKGDGEASSAPRAVAGATPARPGVRDARSAGAVPPTSTRASHAGPPPPSDPHKARVAQLRSAIGLSASSASPSSSSSAAASARSRGVAATPSYFSSAGGVVTPLPRGVPTPKGQEYVPRQRPSAVACAARAAHAVAFINTLGVASPALTLEGAPEQLRSGVLLCNVLDRVLRPKPNLLGMHSRALVRKLAIANLELVRVRVCACASLPFCVLACMHRP